MSEQKLPPLTEAIGVLFGMVASMEPGPEKSAICSLLQDAAPFPVWITEFCLSQGIEQTTAWLYPTTEFWCVVAEGRLKGRVIQAGHWHRSKADAVKQANKVLARAIERQRRQLEILEGVIFTEDGDERTGDRTGESAVGDQGGGEG